MKLYYSKGACSLAVRIVINELNLKCDYESVDLASKQTAAGQDFLKINPKGAVPVLQIEGKEVLTENSIIQQYLADVNRANHLLPPIGDYKRYRVLEWLNYVATEMHKGVGILFYQSIPSEVKEKVFVPLIKSKLAYLDRQLSHKKYLIDDQFTLPDAYLFVILTWTLYFKFNLSEWPNVANYFNELSKRPSIVKSLQEEGLQLMTTP